MRRHRFVLVIAAAVVAAVAVGTPLGAQLPDSLSVKLLRVANDEPAFELTRPAYVAVFEVLPGDGVVQLYPDNSEASRVTTAKGRTYLLAARTNVNRQASHAQFNYAPNARTGVDRLRTTRTILAIASDRPLQATSPAATANILRRVERLRSLRSGRVTMEDLLALVNAVKPAEPEAEVVTDVLEVPPGA